MITALSHANINVTDYDQALGFFVGKLGFEVRRDQTMGPYRWLTVAPKDQRNLEIILTKVQASPTMDESTAETLRELLDKGALGSGVFTTSDCRATHADLVAKGVEFSQPPTERPYGIEAVLRDPFGNWFALVQPNTP
jgi:predicted enzyme related to lactoylglutathione lyase